MAMVGAVVGLAGAAVGAMGQIQQAEAQAAEARYQAQVAKNNQKIAKQNARYEIKVGRMDAKESKMRTRALISTTKAAQGASGVDVDFGSPVDVRVSEAMIGEMDALKIRANARRRAYEWKVQAKNYSAEGKLLEMQADNAETAGKIAAAGTILGGLSGFASAFGGMGGGGGGGTTYSPAPAASAPSGLSLSFGTASPNRGYVNAAGQIVRNY